jgi:aldose 1-epimerase
MRYRWLFLTFCLLAPAQDYTAERTSDQGIPIIRLADKVNQVEVAVVPSVGNIAYEMKVRGKNILHFPYASLAEFRRNPQMAGIPLLAPWASRLDQPAFFANGKRYNFDLELGNVRGPVPMHGLVWNTPHWEVATVAADSRSARYTARLRFWRHPDLMAQWPIAHEYEMTYQLRDGELEVRLAVTNLSAEAMPVSFGFHPYFTLPGIPRDQYTLHIPARARVQTDDRLLPTGAFRPMDLAPEFSLRGITLDDGFIDLVRGPNNRAVFTVKSGGVTLEASFGPNYPAAVVWVPNQNGQPQPFLCIEPMTGIANAINLAAAGKYPALQTIAPGARWMESFWIKASGL